MNKFLRKLLESAAVATLSSAAAAAGSAAVERYYGKPEKDHACPLCESKITGEQYEKAMKECQVVEPGQAPRVEKRKKGKKKS